MLPNAAPCGKNQITRNRIAGRNRDNSTASAGYSGRQACLWFLLMDAATTTEGFSRVKLKSPNRAASIHRAGCRQNRRQTDQPIFAGHFDQGLSSSFA